MVQVRWGLALSCAVPATVKWQGFPMTLVRLQYPYRQQRNLCKDDFKSYISSGSLDKEPP